MVGYIYYCFIAMEVSVQTERRKKVELPQVNASSLPEVQEQDQKQKERKIKKLTMINRELIDTLKRQNDQLTRKINKQKLKVGRSVERAERAESPSRNLEKEKKELANAYKQIEMYKTVLKDLKAKEISTESIDKLNQLENRIRFEDGTIDKLQKESKYVKNIKEQQEKELHLYENQDVKASVGELEEELKKLKEKLKQSKKEAKKREEYALKQHGYFMELQKTLRKHNDEYYPGVTNANNKLKKNEQNEEAEDITQKEWQTMRTQLAELKKVHEDNNKKIEQLTRLRNKEVKSSEENEERLKDKQRKLQAVRSKMAELAKLVGIDKEEKQTGQTKRNAEAEENEEGGRYEGVMQNGKKVFKAKNPDDEREVKRWIVPQGYVQQRGKILPDSTFFSDKSYLRMTKKSKIEKVQVWTNSAGVPSIFQFHYIADDGKWIDGILAYSLGELQELQDRVIEFKEGDYLAKIQGKFQDGLLSGLTLISKFGKKEVFNPIATGEQFKFQPRPNEIPTCIFGASIRDYCNNIRICHIGCEFIADW